MTDDRLEALLQSEVGQKRLGVKRPSSSERYTVSTWVWSEWCRITDQKKNIPWWRVHYRWRARRKEVMFQTALHVLQNYVPTRDGISERSDPEGEQ
jgi:hypothetical protein